MGKRKKASPAPVIAARIASCREQMAKHGLPAYLITDHRDTFYVSGFTGEDSAVLITPRAVHIVSDARFDQAIDNEAPWARKRLRKGLLVDEIGALVVRLKIERLGVQPETMTVAMHGELRKAAKPTRIVLAPPITRGLRERKDATELKVLNRAIAVAQDAFKATRRSIRVGQTEREVAARLEYEMGKRGASGPAFGTICAVGANASHPHAHAGDRKIRQGQAVLLDWGARVGFYCSDLTRVLFIGRIPSRIAGIYDIVLDAQLAAIDAIRPGKRMCDIDQVARRIITKAGFGRQFGHGLGHGLGLNVHESPSLSWRSKERLMAGMVVTVEPGIYLPGVGGVRIEDDVLVTSGGCRVLSDLTKDKQDAVV